MQEQQKYDASWDIFVLVWCSVASYCAVTPNSNFEFRHIIFHSSLDGRRMISDVVILEFIFGVVQFHILSFQFV